MGIHSSYQGRNVSISRKEFDEMKGNVQELVVSVKDLVQLNLENRKQLKDDIEKSFERIERKRIAEYDSLTKEMKGLKADQTSSTKTLGSAIHMVASKLYDISRKVDALQRATSTAPLTPYPTISAALLSADSIQTQISHILTMLHHILIFLKENKPKDDATTSSTAPSVTEISEAVSKLFDYQTQALKDEYIHFQKEINDLSENVLIQRHAIEKLAMGRQTDAEGIVQVMTQFRDVIIEAHRSFDALNCNAEMLANSWRFGPSSKRDDDPNGEDGKRVSGSSIDELEP